MDNDLVEVSQHVVNVWQVLHLDFEAEGLGDIDYLGMDVIRPQQVWSLVLLVPLPDVAQDLLLSSLLHYMLLL